MLYEENWKKYRKNESRIIIADALNEENQKKILELWVKHYNWALFSQFGSHAAFLIMNEVNEFKTPAPCI